MGLAFVFSCCLVVSNILEIIKCFVNFDWLSLALLEQCTSRCQLLLSCQMCLRSTLSFQSHSQVKAAVLEADPALEASSSLCLAMSIVVILFQGAAGFLSWRINNKISFVSESSHCFYVWLFDLEGMPWWDCFGQGKFQSVFWWMIHHCELMRMSKGVVAKKAKSAVIHCFQLFIKLVFIVFDWWHSQSWTPCIVSCWQSNRWMFYSICYSALACARSVPPLSILPALVWRIHFLWALIG